jgi:N-acetylglucosaminyl-diphospho-decaprenol L-rhamnosyltransferase
MDYGVVSSVIVTYNSSEVITNLLSDLFRIHPGGSITIIDNASSDQTLATIRNQFPGVSVVANPENIGYARAVNLGVKGCLTPYILVLNPDIRIPEPHTIEIMAKFLDTWPSAGAVGPLQYTVVQDGLKLNFVCSYWGWKAFIGYFYHQANHRWPSHQPIKVPFLNAGCLMIRRSAFIQVGMINPKYFLYGEDPDLGLKYMRYGYESWILPEIHIIHYREKSLQSLPPDLQKKINRQARINIIDALVRGCSLIIFDRLAGHRLPRR